MIRNRMLAAASSLAIAAAATPAIAADYGARADGYAQRAAAVQAALVKRPATAEDRARMRKAGVLFKDSMTRKRAAEQLLRAGLKGEAEWHYMVAIATLDLAAIVLPRV
jgi:hypothetical protein